MFAFGVRFPLLFPIVQCQRALVPVKVPEIFWLALPVKNIVELLPQLNVPLLVRSPQIVSVIPGFIVRVAPALIIRFFTLVLAVMIGWLGPG